MRYAYLTPVHDDMDPAAVEGLRAAAVLHWLELTGSAGKPDEVELLEEARIGGQWITDGTEAETSYHRSIRVAGELVLQPIDRQAVETLGRAIGALTDALPVSRNELVDEALGSRPPGPIPPYEHAVYLAIEALRFPA